MQSKASIDAHSGHICKLLILKGHCLAVYVVCRLGNDSQLAVQILQKHGIENARDIAGGLYKWATDIDDTFPIY